MKPKCKTIDPKFFGTDRVQMGSIRQLKLTIF